MLRHGANLGLDKRVLPRPALNHRCMNTIKTQPLWEHQQGPLAMNRSLAAV